MSWKCKPTTTVGSFACQHYCPVYHLFPLPHRLTLVVSFPYMCEHRSSDHRILPALLHSCLIDFLSFFLFQSVLYTLVKLSRPFILWNLNSFSLQLWTHSLRVSCNSSFPLGNTSIHFCIPFFMLCGFFAIQNTFVFTSEHCDLYFLLQFQMFQIV